MAINIHERDEILDAMDYILSTLDHLDEDTRTPIAKLLTKAQKAIKKLDTEKY